MGENAVVESFVEFVRLRCEEQMLFFLQSLFYCCISTCQLIMNGV